MRKPLTFTLADAQKLEPLTDRIQRLDGILDPRGPDAAVRDALARQTTDTGRTAAVVNDLRLGEVWANVAALANLCGIPTDAPTPAAVHYVPGDYSAFDTGAVDAATVLQEATGISVAEYAAMHRADNGELPHPPTPDPVEGLTDPFFAMDWPGKTAGWKSQDPAPQWGPVRIGPDAANSNNRRIYVGPGEGEQWAKVYGQDGEMADARAAVLKDALQGSAKPGGWDAGIRHRAPFAARCKTVDEVAAVREAEGDLKSHRGAWRLALVIARERVRAPGDEVDEVDDRAYWDHELRAFDRTFTALVGSSPDMLKVWESFEQEAVAAAVAARNAPQVERQRVAADFRVKLAAALGRDPANLETIDQLLEAVRTTAPSIIVQPVKRWDMDPEPWPKVRDDLSAALGLECATTGDTPPSYEDLVERVRALAAAARPAQ